MENTCSGSASRSSWPTRCVIGVGERPLHHFWGQHRHAPGPVPPLRSVDSGRLLWDGPRMWGIDPVWGCLAQCTLGVRLRGTPRTNRWAMPRRVATRFTRRGALAARWMIGGRASVRTNVTHPLPPRPPLHISEPRARATLAKYPSGLKPQDPGARLKARAHPRTPSQGNPGIALERRWELNASTRIASSHLSRWGVHACVYERPPPHHGSWMTPVRHHGSWETPVPHHGSWKTPVP